MYLNFIRLEAAILSGITESKDMQRLVSLPYYCINTYISLSPGATLARSCKRVKEQRKITEATQELNLIVVLRAAWLSFMNHDNYPSQWHTLTNKHGVDTLIIIVFNPLGFQDVKILTKLASYIFFGGNKNMDQRH